MLEEADISQVRSDAVPWLSAQTMAIFDKAVVEPAPLSGLAIWRYLRRSTALWPEAEEPILSTTCLVLTSLSKLPFQKPFYFRGALKTFLLWLDLHRGRRTIINCHRVVDV